MALRALHQLDSFCETVGHTYDIAIGIIEAAIEEAQRRERVKPLLSVMLQQVVEDGERKEEVVPLL